MNRVITISVAGSSKSTKWAASQFEWQDFAQRLKTPIRSTETYAEYMASSKAQQDALKNVGGFVGGTFKGLRRLTADCTGRDLLTLDLDSIKAWATQDVIKAVRDTGYEAVIYSTRKHSERTPRLRVVLPLTETIDPDRYEPTARKLTENAGLMGYADPTTFEVGRMMYWPSCSADSDYVYEHIEGRAVNAESILTAGYADWHDITSWPQVPGYETVQRRTVARAEDPTMKRGLIGAFCRAYTMQDAMDKFLPGLYEETNDPTRRTFTGGSTYGGAVIYDDKFLFSHHATDPVSGTLVNAWDLVRVQKYASDGQDDDARDGAPVSKLPSFAAMTELAQSDELVRKQLLADRITVEEAFADAPAAAETAEAQPPEDEDKWQMKLKLKNNGAVADCIENFQLIVDNCSLTKGAIANEVFSSRMLMRRAMPWDAHGLTYPRMYIDSDDNHIQAYIESAYGIYNKSKCEAAVNMSANRNRYNVVAEFLSGLTWDGKPRLGTMLTDYLGVNDSDYTRAVAKKLMVAAVARAMSQDKPIKFDYMPILTGPQGIGKSTFLRYLAVNPSWFNDSMTSFEGKDAQEVIQGSWIIEVGELAAMNKQESNAVKQFLGKVDDKYRAAYDRRTMAHIRRCVFIGTTNDDAFLRDVTGNRRFWPVKCYEVEPSLSVFEDLEAQVPQIWAEAVMYWRLGLKLYMDTEELQQAALDMQEGYRQVSSWEGVIAKFLDEPIAEEWYEMDATQRKIWRADQSNLKRDDLPRRTKVCIMEIWEEMVGRPFASCSYQQKQELNQAMRALKGWRETSGVRAGPYGRQRGFVKK